MQGMKTLCLIVIAIVAMRACARMDGPAYCGDMASSDDGFICLSSLAAKDKP